MERREKLEIDIELKDLVFEFLRKWRLIVCCALIGGLVLGAISFTNSYKHVNTPSAPIVEETTPSAQEVIDSLTIDELPDVVAAVELKAQIDDKTAYLKDSFLMKIDPFHENRISLEYLIVTDDIATAVSSYENLIANTNFEEGVYANELVSVNANNDSNVVVVEVIHVDAEQCRMLAEEVKTIWEKHSTTLVRNGVLLEERLISEVESVVVDDALHQHQDAYLKECMDDQDTLAKMRADMNANQVAGYFHMWNAMYGEVEEAENTSTEITNSVVQNIEPTKASISVKQVILGMILGAVLAVVYIFMAYIMTGKLRTAGEVEKLYGVKMLGAMQNTQQKKKAFAAIDKLVWKLEHGKNAVVDCKEQRKLVAASVYIQCQKYETSKVYASGSKFVNIPADIMNALKEELATMGITLVIGKDITNDADALLEASKAGNVLFVEEKRVSAYKDILKGVQMCANNHIRVLGTVVVE